MKELPKVKLTGIDGNVFSIFASVNIAMKNHYEDRKIATDMFNKYKDEAMSGDYDHVLRTTMKHCDVS